MTADVSEHIAAAIGQIPQGRFVLTAAHEEARSGMIVQWIQRCSDNPPMVVVALRKGQRIEPLIRDSRGFVLCQLAEDDQLLSRRFAGPPDVGDHPFLSTPIRLGRTRAPILERAHAFLDCELVRHIDIESEYELYVGLVRDGGILDQSGEDDHSRT